MLTPLFGVAVLGMAAVGGFQDLTLQARGYSWILDRAGDHYEVYHRAGDTCWPDEDGESLASSFSRGDQGGQGLVRLSDEAEQSTIYAFDRMPALPSACLQPDRSDRAAVVAIADLMENHYPGFEARGLDFPTRRAAVLSGLPADPTPDQAYAAAERLLAGISDSHLELSAQIDGVERALSVSEGRTLDAVQARDGGSERAWLATWRRGIEGSILDGEAHFGANDRVAWGVRDGVGYLMVLTMGGFDPDDDAALGPLDDILDQAFASFADARAVVVDVSNNRGGYDGVSLRIAGRFADRPRVAYLKRGWASGVPSQAIEVRPSDRQRYLGPVWLLTSDITVSAGETFAQAMRVLPNVVHAGTATRGAFSDQTAVPLANGWQFAMPMEIYSSPDGRRLEGQGLVPRRTIELYPEQDLDQGHAAAVRDLMSRLR